MVERHTKNTERFFILKQKIVDREDDRASKVAGQENEQELKRQNQYLQLLGAIALKIRQSLQVEEILQTTVAEVRQLLECDRVLIYRLWEDGTGSAVTEAVIPEWLAVLGKTFPAEVFPKEYHQLYCQGRIQAIRDVEKAEISPCLIEFLQEFGVKAKLVVPILLKEKLWGLLVAHECAKPRQWSSFEMELLKQIADHLGIAVAQAQMVETLRKSEERYALAMRAANDGLWDWNLKTKEVYFSPRWKALLGYSEREIGNSIDEWLKRVHPHALEQVKTEIAAHLEGQTTHFESEHQVLHQDGTYRWILARGLAEKNADGFFERMAGSFSDITERKQAESAWLQQTERERLVAQMAQRIRQSLKLEDILNTTAAQVRQFLGCDRVLLYRVWSDGTGSAVTEAVANGWEAILGRTFPAEVFPQDYHQLYCSGRIRAIADVENEPIAPCLVEFLHELQVKAKLVVAILQGNALWGLLIAHQCSRPRQWQQLEIDLLSSLATQVAIAIQQSELYHQLQGANLELQCLASEDSLTAIANRRCFDETLNKEWFAQALQQQPLSLILCDIDCFKLYNDTYGHQAGDNCLQQVAKAISRAAKRPSDLVARYGGEEFAVILPNTEAEGAVKVAEEIRSYLKHLNIVHANSYVDSYVTLSLGVATTVPSQQTSVTMLIAFADEALYQAKKQGRDRVVLQLYK